MSANFLPATFTPPELALANHLWQSTLVACIAGLLTLTLRRNHARARYALWLAASIKFLVPFSLLMVLGAHLTSLRPATPQHHAAAGSLLAIEQINQPFTLAPDFDAAPRPAAPAAAPSISARLAGLWNRGPLLPAALAAIWLIGFLAVSLRWTMRWRRISAAIQLTAPLHAGREFEILQRMQRLAGLRRTIELRPLPASMEPGIFGLFRPVLLWPQAITARLEDTHLEAVLAHEVCHVRRRDNLTAALHMLVEALFWFHPLVWWLETRLVAERENACDEAVLALCGHRRIYAESILKVCEFCVETPLACVSGVTGADLKRRIAQILADRTALKLTLAKKLLLTATALLVVAVPLVLGQANGARRMMLVAVASAPKPFRLAAHAMMPLDEVPSTGLIATREMEAAPETITMPVALTQEAAETSPAPPDTAGAAQVSAAKPITFDVVSIKLNKGGTYSTSDIFPENGDGMILTNWTLERIIKFAYAIHREPGLDGLPPWAKNDHYDIEAKVAQADIVAWRKLSGGGHRIMLRALLADSFQLKMHNEDRDLPVYSLVAVKGGPKNMKETKAADLDKDLSRGMDGTPLGGWVFEQRQQKPGGPMVAHQMSMGYFLFWLNQLNLGRPIYNHTGLEGNYDFTLQFAPMQTAASPSAAPETDAAAGPSIFTALQEQLGLKLEPARGPVPVMVVDHVEQPAAN